MTAKSVQEAGENPLVPNAKLRQMYIKMLAARMLDEATAKQAAAKGRRKRPSTIRGQEAVRVSTVLDLSEDDLVSDSVVTAGMGLLLEGDASSLLRGLTRAKTDNSKIWAKAGVRRVLHATSDAEERLYLVLGASFALKTQGRRGVVIAYAYKDELTRKEWRKLLSAAARLELPIIFVALAQNNSREKNAELAKVCVAAKAAGIPGISVDACDAVALYRVTQESLSRARGGDGPVLIETVKWRMKGQQIGEDDPLEHLKESLLARKICNVRWFKETHQTARRQLFARKRASKSK